MYLVEFTLGYDIVWVFGVAVQLLHLSAESIQYVYGCSSDHHDDLKVSNGRWLKRMAKVVP